MYTHTLVFPVPLTGNFNPVHGAPANTCQISHSLMVGHRIYNFVRVITPTLGDTNIVHIHR